MGRVSDATPRLAAADGVRPVRGIHCFATTAWESVGSTPIPTDGCGPRETPRLRGPPATVPGDTAASREELGPPLRGIWIEDQVVVIEFSV